MSKLTQSFIRSRSRAWTSVPSANLSTTGMHARSGSKAGDGRGQKGVGIVRSYVTTSTGFAWDFHCALMTLRDSHGKEMRGGGGAPPLAEG